MDERIKTVISYLSANIDKPLELKDLARVAFLSPVHFHRIFKNEFGLSVKKFIQNYKMEKAFLLVTDAGTNIMDIALALGYNNYETFSRAFKRHYKISPDDLKAIILRAVGEIELKSPTIKKLLVVTDKKESESESIISDIAKNLISGNLRPNDLMKSKVITVRSIGLGAAGPHKVEVSIKNKYAIKDRSIEWKEIVKKLSAENLL